MDNLKYARKITRNNLAMIFSSPRLYIVLAAVILCLRVFLDELPIYLAEEGQKVGMFELLPVFNSRLTQLVIYLGWILLISEIPFFSTNQTNTLIRTNRMAVLEGCMGYILLLALVYVLLLQAGSVCMLGFQSCLSATEWSETVTLAAKYGGNMIGIQSSLVFDYGIVESCTPIQAWGIQMVVAFLLFATVGMVLFCGKLLKEWFFVGYIVSVGLWAWDFVIVEFFMKEELLWFSRFLWQSSVICHIKA